MTENVTTLRDDTQGGYPLESLERLVRDSENQPAWRDRSDLCYAYVDGRQMTPEQKREHLKNKLEPRTINLIGRVVRSVLGTQAKTRRDPRVETDDEAFADVAEVISSKLAEARRETHAPMACSNAYASEVIAGLGWVEVSRNSDLLGYKYRVQDVHRSEIWWDWRAKQLDLSDARWLCRRRWMDLDEIVAKLPQHKDLLEQVVGNWAGVVMDDWHDERWQAAYDADRRFGVSRAEWWDGGRRRLKLYETWYRVPKTVMVFRVRGGEWRELNLDNPLHVAAVNRGVVEISKTVTMEIRMALFAGPHRLIDKATKKKRFPYIPFWAFRRDEDRTPYGLVEGMLAPQDEYNELSMRIQWMRKAQQLLIDNDALDQDYNTIQDIADSMMRPDMVAVLNGQRKNPDGLVMRNDMQLQKEQYESMANAKELIQDIPGIYSTQMGNAPAGVTSGIAINSLVEQGILAMGDLNDNYQFGEMLVNECLVDMIVEDLAQPNTVTYVGTGATRRQVVLNTRDPQTGAPMNMVVDAPIKCGLAEVPSSPAYRMQTGQQIAGMIQALAGNPQAVAVLAPAYIESSDLPDRKAMADDLRRVSGLPVSGDRAGAQAWQQQQQQQAADQAQLAQQGQAAEIQHKQALVQKDTSAAALNTARAQRESLLAHRDAASPLPGQEPSDPTDTAINDAINEAHAA
jgi:hypothetical protein